MAKAEKNNLEDIIRAQLAEARQNALDEKFPFKGKDEGDEEDDDEEDDDEESSKKDGKKKHAKKSKKDEDGEDDSVDEEYEEELDEVSNNTLRSYIGKASKDRKNTEARQKRAENNLADVDKDERGMRRMAGDSKYFSDERRSENRTKGLARARSKIKENMDEETIAASTLHPGARSVSDNKSLDGSRVGMLQNMMHMAGSLTKSDLTDFYDKVMSQFGPGKTYGVGDNSGKNQSSIDMKASLASKSVGPKTKDGMPKLDSKNHWAEDVEEMFANSDLSEDFKEQASTIFEAAINARLMIEAVRLEEEFEEALVEEIETITEELSDKLDAYLDHVVENWLEENAVAIESTLRNEIMEEFIDNLQKLFTDNYMNIPESKIDVLEALTDKVGELETRLDESITENSELKDIVAESVKEEIFFNLAEDLALTQKEKFSALAEGIEFNGDFETYEKKLRIIKENYFRTDNNASSTTYINEETFDGDIGGETVNIDPSVNRYLHALNRTVKN